MAQGLGEVFYSIFIVVLAPPFGEVNGGRDCHVYIVLDVSLERNAALVVLSQVDSTFHFLWISPIELDELFCRSIDNVLVVPPITIA